MIDIFEVEAKSQQPSICIGFYYIRYSDSANLTVRHCLEVLVKQTVERHPCCLEVANKLYAEHARLQTRPTEADLKLQLLHQFTTLVRLAGTARQDSRLIAIISLPLQQPRAMSQTYVM